VTQIKAYPIRRLTDGNEMNGGLGNERMDDAVISGK